jgi:hypothetical protein
VAARRKGHNKASKGIQSVEHGMRLLEALIEARKALPLKLLADRAGMSATWRIAI